MRIFRFCRFCFCFLTCLALTSAADIPSSEAAKEDLSVILDFKGVRSQPLSLKEMEREASHIIRASGVRLGWHDRSEVANLTFHDLVVMTFNGTCASAPAPPRYDELGPYALTHTSDGRVQPFGEVDCDRVVSSVRAVLFGGELKHADLLVGRALGRVVAHELVHMLTKSGEHGSEGVHQAALSPRQLIGASLNLSAFDIDRVKLQRRLP